MVNSTITDTSQPHLILSTSQSTLKSRPCANHAPQPILTIALAALCLLTQFQGVSGENRRLRHEYNYIREYDWFEILTFCVAFAAFRNWVVR